jgi:PIN domain nuclease of toxin-antitoxin system
MSVSADHAMGIEALAPLRGDPFDRLFVAQALTEPLRLITHDEKVAAYSDTFVYF